MSRFAIAALLIVGCSPDSIAIGDLNARLARADCDHYTRCHLYDSVDRCLGYATPGPITGSIEAAVAAGLVDYDGEQAAECVAEHDDLSCSLNDLLVKVQPSALCRGVLRAGRKLGDACALDAECDSRNCVGANNCNSDTCCVGTCVEARHLSGLMGNCSGIECAPDLWCDNNFTCEALLPQGAFCYDLGSCASGLDCADGRCQPTPHEGDTCLFQDDVGLPPTCGVQLGLACDQRTETCEPSLGLGAPCDPGSDFPGLAVDRCATGWLRCDPDTKVCTEFPKVGEPCTSLCEPHAYCWASGEGSPAVCLPLVDDGSPCTFDQECASFSCSTMTQLCVEPAVCT